MRHLKTTEGEMGVEQINVAVAALQAATLKLWYKETNKECKSKLFSAGGVKNAFLWVDF